MHENLQFYSILKHFNCKPRFNGVYARDNLPRVKDGAHVINLYDKQSKGKHWLSLFFAQKIVEYFDSFVTEYNLKEVLSKIKNRSITHDIFRIQFDDSFIYGSYCIVFMECMIARKTLLDHINLFSPSD